MARVDWTKMTPAEVLASLKDAPKVAGPWVTSEGGIVSHRHTFDGGWVSTDTKDYPERGVRLHAFWPGSSEWYRTRDEADAALRAAGWILVDDAPPAAPALPSTLDPGAVPARGEGGSQ